MNHWWIQRLCTTHNISETVNGTISRFFVIPKEGETIADAYEKRMPAKYYKLQNMKDGEDIELMLHFEDSSGDDVAHYVK